MVLLHFSHMSQLKLDNQTNDQTYLFNIGAYILASVSVYFWVFWWLIGWYINPNNSFCFYKKVTFDVVL